MDAGPNVPANVDLRAEVSRKLLHISSAAIPLSYCFIPRGWMLGLLAGCLAIAIAVEWARRHRRLFAGLFRRSVGFMLRETEWRRVTGATYIFVAALLCVWWYDRPLAIAVLLILSFADSAASLMGLRFGRWRFWGKSVAGSGAFFLCALAILAWMLPGQLELAALGALVATIVEAAPSAKLGPLELNDNLMVPVLTGLFLTAALARIAP